MNSLARVGKGAIVAMLLAATGLNACGRPPITAPTQTSLAGRWLGALTGRAPCVGDWTRLTLTLQASGVGDLMTNDGQHFSVAQLADAGVMRIDVALPPGPGECQTLSLVISQTSSDAAGSVTSLSGDAIGRCCGTIAATFRFDRG